MMKALLAASLLLASPAYANVIYDFVVTSASGTQENNYQFSGPNLTLTVTDAVYASGSYQYSLTPFCSAPPTCQHTGDPNGIDIMGAYYHWMPLYGAAAVNLTFTPTTVTGSISKHGEFLDLTMNSTSGTINSDYLNCVTPCAFVGHWKVRAAGAPLPTGYFHVVGNQVVSNIGVNVRLACIGYEELTGNPSRDLAQMRALGFNCVRPDVADRDHCPGGVCSFTGLDAIVAAATANSMKVIFSHHSNEGSASGGNCGAQQANGLWYDVNDSTVVDGVAWNTLSGNQNGCGTAGTVTYSRFKANSIALAAHYAGNSTVIAWDLWNEPIIGNPICVQPGCQATILNWGGNNGSDIRLMCEKVGQAIEAAAPGVLIICEGPINVSGHFLNGAAFPVGLDNIADLTKAQTNPVVVTNSGQNKVVYSIHDYPNSVNGSGQAQSGAAFVTNRNVAWGFLEANNIAPVWIGENGASLDNSNGQGVGENQWANSLVAYLNGQAAGGPTFAAGKQPMGSDWWWFGCGTAACGGLQQIDGIYTNPGLTTLNTFQSPIWGALLYTP